MWYNIKKNYVGTQQVRPSGWTPNENTLLYLPLQSDVVDKSWKTGRTFTTSWLSYTTVGGVPSVHVWTTWWIYLTAPNPLASSSIDKTKQTISICYYVTSQTSSTRRSLFEFAKYWEEYFSLVLKENTTILQYSGGTWVGSWTTIVANQWNNVVVTSDTTTRNIYINWQLAWSWSPWSNPPRWSWNNTSEEAQWILTVRGWWYNQSLNWNARELIMEDKLWSAEDVSKYYQRIKAKLWF